MLQPFPVNRPAVMARHHMISAGHTIMTNGGAVGGADQRRDSYASGW